MMRQDIVGYALLRECLTHYDTFIQRLQSIVGIAGCRCRGQMQAARNSRSRAICGPWRMRGRKSPIAARRTGDAVLPLNLFTDGAFKLQALLALHAFILLASCLCTHSHHRRSFLRPFRAWVPIGDACGHLSHLFSLVKFTFVNHNHQ